MRKFTESIKQIDIFEREDILKDILLEYSDEGYNFAVHYKLYKSHTDGDGDYFVPILSSGNRSVNNRFLSTSLEDIFNKSDEKFPKDVIRSYHIAFEEVFYLILANDKQRGNRRNFAIPDKKLYNFFKITEAIQERIESMGYYFLLSVHENAEFDILIMEKSI
jgi:hypothetical protein